MATVIRLKRRVDEDPLNAFVLNCKRQRVEGEVTGDEDDNANEAAAAGTSTILKFAGTFTKAEGIASHIQNIHKDQAKDALSRVHRPNITSRNRLATKQSAQNSRFKIVNCTRSIAAVESSDSSDNPITTTIVDVEREPGVARLENVTPDMPALSGSVTPDIVNSATIGGASNLQQHQSEQLPYFYENGVHYVYDLYVADASQNVTQIPYYIDNLDDLSVMVCDDPLYSSHRGLDSDDSSDTDSEDSNAEGNWRNDYPDEEDRQDGDSVDEEDMLRAVEDLDLEGERELSSDEDYVRYDNGEEDGEDGFAYPRNDGVLYTDEEEDSDTDTQGVNRDDVRRYGTAYARYKARILREEKRGHADSSSSSSEENFDLYD